MIERLNEILKEKNLSVYQLSKMTGIPTGTFSNLKKSGRKCLSFENMEKVADALEISLDVFRKDKS